MFIDQTSRRREGPVELVRSRWLHMTCGLLALGSTLGASGALAQEKLQKPAAQEAEPMHPAFAAKLKNPKTFSARAFKQQEDTCDDVDDSQNVRDYDGTLGQTTEFVNAYENRVGKLEMGNVGCSGTMIARNLFITASHCVDHLTGTDTVAFEYEYLAGTNTLATAVRYDVAEVVEDGANLARSLDFAILRLANRPGPINQNPGDTFGIAQLDQLSPSTGHLITIIQHPDGDPKRVEVGHVHSHTEATIRYDDLDTQGGSSGSGILDDEGKLVGVHTNGGCEDGKQNFGQRMSAIAAVSPTIQGLLSPTVLSHTDRLTLLRVHEVGTKYGPPGEQIDAEVIVTLAGLDKALGFKLRTGTDEATHRGMVTTLREAFKKNVPVRVEYERETHRTQRITRVIRQ